MNTIHLSDLRRFTDTLQRLGATNMRAGTYDKPLYYRGQAQLDCAVDLNRLIDLIEDEIQEYTE